LITIEKETPPAIAEGELQITWFVVYQLRKADKQRVKKVARNWCRIRKRLTGKQTIVRKREKAEYSLVSQ
jgi:hypothetical protein